MKSDIILFSFFGWYWADINTGSGQPSMQWPSEFFSWSCVHVVHRQTSVISCISVKNESPSSNPTTLLWCHQNCSWTFLSCVFLSLHSFYFHKEQCVSDVQWQNCGGQNSGCPSFSELTIDSLVSEAPACNTRRPHFKRDPSPLGQEERGHNWPEFKL